MSSQHTPGPYKVNHRGDEVMVATGSSVGLTLAKVTQFVPAHRSQSKANAILFAAAPELLEALYQYRDDLRYPPAPDSVERRLAMIDALIAKADGRA